MKRIVLLSLVLLFILTPVFSVSFYFGGTAEAMYNAYLPYDFSTWFQGFWGKARFPLGANMVFAFDKLPFALEVGGGYYPEVNVCVDPTEDGMPFYIEALAYYVGTNLEKDQTARNFSGGGLGVFLRGEFPTFYLIGESKWVWTPLKHMYLSLALRGNATFDIAPSASGTALGFFQMGLGVKTGIGVVF